MFTRIDHLIVDCPDLDRGADVFARMGFTLRPDGEIRLQQSSVEDGIWAIALQTDDRNGDASALGALNIPNLMAVHPRDLPAVDHPNGVQRLERVYVIVDNLKAQAELYAAALGCPVPAVQRGTVINADMAVFQLGESGLALAYPAGPGPAAEAFKRIGVGPFQALYRTASLKKAEGWILDHGLPAPQRGTRNTGETAMLMGPETAFGAYIGFVGPE